eukprot:TRINITY_DN42760_c0_g1_i1.p1 TRINITY_DN42760_c0_g1~~TRINITY_DN42760_c0_g1_i1.p1  ORF type:complete len:503 (-),score=62.07 TRINITY_DN42760_c0_g1_i1:155-1576(-)
MALAVPPTSAVRPRAGLVTSLKAVGFAPARPDFACGLGSLGVFAAKGPPMGTISGVTSVSAAASLLLSPTAAAMKAAADRHAAATATTAAVTASAETVDESVEPVLSSSKKAANAIAASPRTLPSTLASSRAESDCIHNVCVGGNHTDGVACGERLYDLVVYNLTPRTFTLTGASDPRCRRVPQGRLLRVATSIPSSVTPAVACAPTLAPALAPLTSRQSPPVAQAAFHQNATLGDLLEFTLSFVEAAGEGFTVRVHAHARSPLRSDAAPSGQDLDVSSTIEEVGRLVAQPPLGYERTAMGVYSSPELVKGTRLGELTPGAEVFSAERGGIGGRWLRITAPLEGWVMASTRDGTQLFSPLSAAVDEAAHSSKALSSCLWRPHIRQVIILRPRAIESRDGGFVETSKGSAVSSSHGFVRSDASREARLSLPNTARIPQQLRPPEAEARRLHREKTLVEGAFPVGRTRRALLGVF